MRTVFSGVSRNILIKAGLKQIQSGSILSVKIIENQNGLIKAAVQGRILFIKGSPDLKPGSSYRVRAQWQGKTLKLQLVQKNNNPFNTSLNSPADEGHALLFEASKRAGMHLKEANIRLMKRLLKSKEPLTEEKARFASEAVKKGLSPEEMIPIVAGRKGDQDGSRDKTLLFNHLSDDNELWFIIPFCFAPEGGAELSGSLRVRKDLSSGKITLAVLETGIDNRRLFFMINLSGNRSRTVRLFSDGSLEKEIKNRIVDRLPEILSNLSLKFDDNIIESCFQDRSGGGLFDGFSFSELPADGIEEIV